MARLTVRVNAGRNLRMLAGLLVIIGLALGFGSPGSSASPRIPHVSAPHHRVIPAATGQIEAVSFETLTRGYGLFYFSGTDVCADKVGPTSNGGALFAPLVTVTTWPCVDNSIPTSSLVFDHRGDGFLFGPDLFVTHNSGRTWSRIRTAGDVLEIDPIGSSIWMLQTACASPTTRHCPIRLFVSDDGGRNWSPSKLALSGQINPAAVATFENVAMLDRVNRSFAYLVSDPTMNNKGSPAEPALLWRTTNSGASWTKRSIPCGKWNWYVTLSVAPNGELFAACAGQPSAGRQGKSVLSSNDEGLRWHLRSSYRSFSSALGSGYLVSIDAMSAKTLLLVANISSLLVSSNAGADWQYKDQLFSGAESAAPLAIVLGTKDAVILGDTIKSPAQLLWHTTDGGEHWSSVLPRWAYRVPVKKPRRT